MEIIEGNLIDIENREFYPCAISIFEGKIMNIERNSNSYDQYISPGFIDAHVHVESSMLMPVEFSKLVIPNGTVGVIADPHEIANLLGYSFMCSCNSIRQTGIHFIHKRHG